MKEEFIPQGYTVTREVIAEMIHTELTEIHGLDITIGLDHKLLTDELCQQFKVKQLNKLEHYYELTKGLSWDLWSVAILPWELMPADAKPLNNPVAQGPMLNMLAWEDNERIGVEIAIAIHLYKTELSFYGDYDT